MEYFTALFLSRLQFCFVVSFHIIFPAFTIGLASWLAVIEFLWLKTGHPIYKELYQHWVKIFAVTFGMGVVSGVVMSFQFGTNWAIFAQKAGNVIGPVLALEVLTAFFLEASFLGIMLFGWNKVGPRLHFLSTLLVAGGTIVSAFWILSVNSWMQTPAGFEVRADGALYPTSWLEIIFNPSFLHRFMHMILAAYLATAFLIACISSWAMLKEKAVAHAKVAFGMAMLIAVSLPTIQLIVGHNHGVNTLEYQPVKIAAMEGIWETESRAALNLIGLPNEKTETTDYAFQVPGLASIVLKGDINGEIQGLKNWPKEERPPVAPVFFSFRIMVGIGMLMLLTGGVAAVLFVRKKLFSTPWFFKWCFLMGPSGFIAILAGWITTEVGRQPYTIYGILKTSESVSAISAAQVSVSLLTFFIVYSVIFSAGAWYIVKLIRKGPLVGDWHDAYGTHGLNEIPEISDVFPKKLRG